MNPCDPVASHGAQAAAAMHELASLAKERDDLAARLAESSVAAAELLTLRAEASATSSKLSRECGCCKEHFGLRWRAHLW